MGAGEGRREDKARRDLPAAGSHEGDAVRSVLLVVQEGDVSSSPTPDARAPPAAARPSPSLAHAPRQTLHLLAPPQQPHREAEEKRRDAERMQRHQPSHAVQRRREGESRSDRREETEARPAVRRERLLAERTIIHDSRRPDSSERRGGSMFIV